MLVIDRVFLNGHRSGVNYTRELPVVTLEFGPSSSTYCMMKLYRLPGTELQEFYNESEDQSLAPGVNLRKSVLIIHSIKKMVLERISPKKTVIKTVEEDDTLLQQTTV